MTSWRPEMARVHEEAFGFHADRCAPGILDLLAPVRERDGLVLEIGCGTGKLTQHLIAAGHRMIATDASEAMLDVARKKVPGVDYRQLTLPDDPLPAADAIVGVGHPLSYLPDEASLRRGLARIAESLRPHGVLAVDLCDLAWGEAFRDAPPRGRVTGDWAMVTEYETPRPDRFVMRHNVFTRSGAGWRRDDEQHDITLIDTARTPEWLRPHGIDAVVGQSFGAESLPVGLVAVTGGKV